MLIPVLFIFPFLSLFSSSYKIIIDVILAYFFNVTETELTIEGVRKSDDAAKLAKSPRNGDIIIVNATGPLDWFVWKMIAETPNNCKVGVSTDDGIAIFNGWKSWVSWCFQGSLQLPKCAKNSMVHITDIDASSSNADGIADLEKFVGKNGTLYVVVEGTITNNKGVLSFPRGFDAGAFARMAVSANYGFKVMSVKVTPPGISGTVIPTNKWWWLFLNFSSLSMQTKYKLKMSVLVDKYSDNTDENMNPELISDTCIREKLATNGRLKLLGNEMDIVKKREYIQAVTESKEKKYV